MRTIHALNTYAKAHYPLYNHGIADKIGVKVLFRVSLVNVDMHPCAVLDFLQASCVACPRREGAMKQSPGGHWVHIADIFCSEWLTIEPRVCVAHSVYTT